jgi:hypothetical protein
VDLAEAAQEMRRLSDLIDDANGEYRKYVREYANAERDYRHSKARAWPQAPREISGAKATVPEREAWVEGQTAGARHRRDMADGMKRAAWGSLESRKAQLSAIQSLLAAHREEASFARTGPR